jgi:Phage portal protein, lambda family/Phage portal protein, SPP1 Gp6-like
LSQTAAPAAQPRNLPPPAGHPLLVDPAGRPVEIRSLRPGENADGTWQKPLFKTIGSPEKYAPEDTEFADTEVKTDEYVRRFYGRETWQPSKENGLKESFTSGIDAALQMPVIFRESGRYRFRWKPVRIQSMADLREFRESSHGMAKRSLEENGDPFDTGWGGGGSSPFFSNTPGSPTQLIDANDFVPFLNGPFYKQLYQYDYLKMHARAFDLVNHAALAAGAVKIMTRFVLGRGISFSIKNEQAQEVWDDYWERNDMRNKTRQMARDLAWQGELMLRFYEREPGRLTMRIIDPSTCWEIVTDPEDFEHVYYYHFQWPTPYQIWVQGNIPISKYIIQEVPPTNVQHIKINVSSQEKRGRSDLLPSMPWLKRFNDYYNGAVMKAVLEANLVYKIKIHGDQQSLDDIQNNSQFTILPPPGGTWLENDAVDMTPMSAVMTSGRGAQGIGQQIASIVATSLNLPTEYFNIEGGAGGARATALVRTDPAVKAVEDRQQILRESLEDNYDRVMEAALREGRIRPQDVRGEPDVVPDEQQVGDERDPDKELPFQKPAHSAASTRAFQPKAKPPVRASFPGKPVRNSDMGRAPRVRATWNFRG